MVKISIELEVAEHEIPLATELLATLRCDSAASGAALSRGFPSAGCERLAPAAPLPPQQRAPLARL
jgi:hypothetical protein